MPKPFRTDIEGWAWQPDKCPADLYFLEWLDTVSPPKNVFHMGTGLHHNVGRTCSEKSIACTGITVSKVEYDVAPLDKNYQIVLGDIYDLNLNLLPMYDVMTLFHLGEMVDRFGGIHEPNVKRLISKVHKGGQVMFYSKSSAWDRTGPTIGYWCNEGVMRQVGEYKDLVICNVQ